MQTPDDPTKLQPPKDYYYILGLRPDATSEEVQEAYYDLFEKFGPHVNMQGQDPEMMHKVFKDISDAYSILMDPERRRAYDRSSSQLRQSSADLRALWSKHQSAPQQNPDRILKVNALAIEMEVELTLREALKGAKKEVSISDPKPCTECSGMRPATRMQCPACRGLGFFNIERTQAVEVPPGSYDGAELRLEGQGRYDLRAQRHGDLILKIRLLQHPFLSVLGRDITCTIPVTIYEAVLGAEIEVPSGTGRVVMKIQPLTQHGRVYRLKGLGLSGADQLVTIDVLVPQHLSGEEVNMFRRLRELSREPNPREGIFQKL